MTASTTRTLKVFSDTLDNFADCARNQGSPSERPSLTAKRWSFRLILRCGSCFSLFVRLNSVSSQYLPRSFTMDFIADTGDRTVHFFNTVIACKTVMDTILGKGKARNVQRFVVAQELLSTGGEMK